jgi:large subunit ribosomal protein L22
MAKRMKEKKEERLANKDMRPRATASFVRMSPSKVARVLDGIRGKKYKDALAILELAPYSSAEVVKEVMNSAAANAEHNLGMNRDDLFVAECFANSGTMLKRMMPRAKGRGVRILKRTTHITVVLDTAK